MSEYEPEVEVWIVMGDPHHAVFSQKIKAEAYARLLFPNEDEDTRYGRIYYRIVDEEDRI